MKFPFLGKKINLTYLSIFALSCAYFIFSEQILHSGFFIWDDKQFFFHKIITDYNLTSLFTNSHYGLYHPVTSLWVKINILLHGNNPHILHLESLCIHIINGWLVFAILRRLNFNALPGFIVFLFHPLNTEVAYWATSIKDLLSGFFTLISIYFYIIYKFNDRNIYYKFTLVSFILALLSKPQAIVIPFILLLIDFCFSKRLSKKLIVPKLPLFFLSALLIGINLYIRYTDKDLSDLTNYGFFERVLFVCYSFSKQVLTLILPLKQSIFYPYPSTFDNILEILFYSSIPLIYIMALLLAFKRKHREIFFILLTFLIFAVPVIQIIPIGESIYNDRYSYLQTFILAVGVEFIILKIKDKLGIKKVVIPVLIILCIFTLTKFHQRGKLWQNQKKLFLSALDYHPESEIISNTLGVILLKENDFDSAFLFLEKATNLKPDYAQAYYNLGIAYEKNQNTNEAIDQYKKAIALESTYQEPLFRLAQIYFINANYDSAKLIVNQIMRMKPIDADILDLYGKILYQTGDIKSSVKYYESAIRLDMDNPQFLFNLALSVGYLGDYSRANSLLKKSLAIKSDFSEAYYLLGIIQFKLGNDGCTYLKKAQSLGNQLAILALEEYCN